MWLKDLKPIWLLVLMLVLVLGIGSSQKGLKLEAPTSNSSRAFSFLWQSGESRDSLVWPEMKFGWRIIAGTIIGFIGAAFGSVGGIGGGGFFIPMLRLIIGFDPKSSTALSECMIMGTAISVVYYNLKLRHPILHVSIIDYDLALLIQPMLMLGISIGVSFNVVFADWMVTFLIILLCMVTSTKAFLRGVQTLKKETLTKQEAAMRQESNISGAEVEYKPLPGGPNDASERDPKQTEMTVLENVQWKELGLLLLVWLAFLALQIAKNHTATCSAAYWLLNVLQIPVSVGVSMYEAISLYNGWRRIASQGDHGTNFRVHQLVFYCALGLMAGIVGGLLGIGGGSILGPLVLELGVPPQVASATATFAMAFSSSMSVVEYYLLKQFPVPYALYLVGVAIIAAYAGQCIMRKLIILLGRASFIIFILAFTIYQYHQIRWGGHCECDPKD